MKNISAPIQLSKFFHVLILIGVIPATKTKTGNLEFKFWSLKFIISSILWIIIPFSCQIPKITEFATAQGGFIDVFPAICMLFSVKGVLLFQPALLVCLVSNAHPFHLVISKIPKRICGLAPIIILLVVLSVLVSIKSNNMVFDIIFFVPYTIIVASSLISFNIVTDNFLEYNSYEYGTDSVQQLVNRSNMALLMFRSLKKACSPFFFVFTTDMTFVVIFEAYQVHLNFYLCN